MKKIVLFILFILGVFVALRSNVKANNFGDYSDSSILMDMDSGRVLYGKNIHKENLTASIAKIMTCIVAIENGNLSDVCVVDEMTINQIGSSTYLKLGDKIRLKDLLYGMMLRSGNDASYLIGKTVGGNIKEFVGMMNSTALKIGMENSKFENVSGLDEESKNISTAYDMALLMSYCMKNDEFRNIVSCRTHSFTSLLNNNYTFLNKHKLVNGNDNVTGGKTGYTINAKRTLVTSFSKNNIAANCIVARNFLAVTIIAEALLADSITIL